MLDFVAAVYTLIVLIAMNAMLALLLAFRSNTLNLAVVSAALGKNMLN
jgi:hypothetical protein